ncbi:arylsulfatase B-like isoform X1 [Pomacea canaliculata]|uniref:arylsulfatase B-like isoform X1 n=2 Tax=Pomacea canaliculata TaxID=400727 RepID=UPI000D73D35E|nr:arylsulfatase B-like isoform X1 [Pomacea canaliculata]
MLKTWLLVTTVMVLVSIAQAVTSSPNIIFVVADDLGWNDVSWHNPSMITPNLDKYARTGVILNSSYIQYFCSPSRSAFMTGYFPYHTGLQHKVIIEGQPRFVPTNFKMLPAHLKTAGYMTHIVGKWHLGMCNWKYTPTYRGFDSFYGYYNGMDDYYTHRTTGGYDFRSNTSVAEDPHHTHSTYLFTDQTIKVIENHDKSKPLFLYLPFQLVHYPLQVPLKYEQMYKHVASKRRRVYSGMVSMMDEAFGQITEALDSAGLLDNSLIIFTTDNGGSVPHGGNNWPLRGGKTTFWEGGTRGVAFVWSRNLLERTGYTNHEMIHAVDWFPTILHLAGLRPDSNIDGVNQWEMLRTGAPSSRTEFVYNIDTIMNSSAIRYGDYKLLTGSPGSINDWYPIPTQDNTISRTKEATWKPQLYNIRNDPQERNDLAQKQPQILKFMMNRLSRWMASGVKPQTSPVDPRSNPRNWGGVWTPGWC